MTDDELAQAVAAIASEGRRIGLRGLTAAGPRSPIWVQPGCSFDPRYRISASLPQRSLQRVRRPLWVVL